jgi:hypothetical protein
MAGTSAQPTLAEPWSMATKLAYLWSIASISLAMESAYFNSTSAEPFTMVAAIKWSKAFTVFSCLKHEPFISNRAINTDTVAQADRSAHL